MGGPHTHLGEASPCIFTIIPYDYIYNYVVNSRFIFYTWNRSIFISQKKSYRGVNSKREKKNDRLPYSRTRK